MSTEPAAVQIVLSHGGAKAIYEHLRNLDDGRVRELAKEDVSSTAAI